MVLGALLTVVSAASGAGPLLGHSPSGAVVASGGTRAPLIGMRDELTSLSRAVAASRTQLAGLQDEVRFAQIKLGQLESLQQRDDQVLADELVDTYESGRPDFVNVVLDANGVNDALTRLAFARRIAAQDAAIVARVQSARGAVALQAARLGGLSARQQQTAAQELSDIDRLAEARSTLGSRRARSLPGQAGGGASTAQTVSGVSPSPTSPAAHRAVVFPLPRGYAAAPATWSLGDGVDIAAPGDTPERAVCSGTVVLHGVGGLGPSAPVLRCDSPIAGYDYVYYGDAGPGSWTPIATHVKQGQVIAQVGPGIVGTSTGPDLEIGFGDAAGAPLGPASAAKMMSLLRVAYAG
jgi:murein DD-endopeptidase MepM/ murein hydrolase activator NlpD